MGLFCWHYYKQKTTMKTFAIRCTKDEARRIQSRVSSSGFSINSLAKCVVHRVNTVGMSDFTQPIGRVVRRGKRVNRDERIDFKLCPQAVGAFRETLDGSGFNFSEVMRFYLLDQKLLFSKPKKFKNRQSFDPRDFYQTPYPMTAALVEHLADVPRDTAICDPCVGSGAIVDVLRQSFPASWGFDKFVEFESQQKRDFLHYMQPLDLIVTNPPFNAATDFIEHSMKVATKAWFLLPLDYLSSKQRFERVYQNDAFYCSDVRVFSRSPMLSQEKQETISATGKITYAWYCFKKGQGQATMGHFEL